MNTEITNSYCPVLDYIDERVQLWYDRIYGMEVGLKIERGDINKINKLRMFILQMEFCFFYSSNNYYADFQSLIESPVINEPSVLEREIENLLFSIQSERQIELYKKKLNRVYRCLKNLYHSLDYTIEFGESIIEEIERESICPSDENLRMTAKWEVANEFETRGKLVSQEAYENNNKNKTEEEIAQLKITQKEAVEELINYFINQYKTFHLHCDYALQYIKYNASRLSTKIWKLSYAIESFLDLPDVNTDEVNSAEYKEIIQPNKEELFDVKPSVPEIGLMLNYLEEKEWNDTGKSPRQAILHVIGVRHGCSGKSLYKEYSHYNSYESRVEPSALKHLNTVLRLLKDNPKALSWAEKELKVIYNKIKQHTPL